MFLPDLIIPQTYATPSLVIAAQSEGCIVVQDDREAAAAYRKAAIKHFGEFTRSHLL